MDSPSRVYFEHSKPSHFQRENTVAHASSQPDAPEVHSRVPGGEAKRWSLL